MRIHLRKNTLLLSAKPPKSIAEGLMIKSAQLASDTEVAFCDIEKGVRKYKLPPQITRPSEVRAYLRVL